MNEIVFVGLGLNDEKGITVKGLEETKTADHVFMENYTSRMPDFSLERFELSVGKKVQIVDRQILDRITSYNVCYTKLLRTLCAVRSAAGIRARCTSG